MFLTNTLNCFLAERKLINIFPKMLTYCFNQFISIISKWSYLSIKAALSVKSLIRVEKTLQSMHLISVCVSTDQRLFLRWQEQAHCRDSRSTISGGRGGVAFDSLGRPLLHNNSRRGRDRLLDRDEENRLRVETYVRNSMISLVSVSLCMCVPLQVKAAECMSAH